MTMQFEDPANDNDDPDVIFARRIARILSIILAAGLVVYLAATYLMPT